MNHLMPTPTSVDWPSLMAVAERQGIPVSRIDGLGNAHIIRTVAQLAAEWED